MIWKEESFLLPFREKNRENQADDFFFVPLRNHFVSSLDVLRKLSITVQVLSGIFNKILVLLPF